MKIKKTVKRLKMLIGVGFATTSIAFAFLVTNTRVFAGAGTLIVIPDKTTKDQAGNSIYATDRAVQGSTANLITRIIDLSKNFDAQKQRELFRLLDNSSDVLPAVFRATEKINPRFWQDWRCSGQYSNLTEVVSKIDHDCFRKWVGASPKVFAHGWRELVHDLDCDNLDTFKAHLAQLSSEVNGGLIAIDGQLNLDQLLKFGVATPSVVDDKRWSIPFRIIDMVALMGRDRFFRYLTAFEHYPCTPVTFACAIVGGNIELIRSTWDQLAPRDKRQALICGIAAFAERGNLADPDQVGIIQWLLNLCGEVTEATFGPVTEDRKLKAVLAHTFLATAFKHQRADSVRLVIGADKTPDQIKALLSGVEASGVEEELLKSLVDLEHDQPVATALACLVNKNDRTSLQWLLDTLREKFPKSVSDEITKRMVLAHDGSNNTVLLSLITGREIASLSEDVTGLVLRLPGIRDIIDYSNPNSRVGTFAAQCALMSSHYFDYGDIHKDLLITALRLGADFRKIPIGDYSSTDVAKLILDQVPDKEAVISYLGEQLATFNHTSPKILELIAKNCGIVNFHQSRRFYLLLHYFVAHRELDNARNILVNLGHAPEMLRSCLYCRDLNGKTPLDLAREQAGLTHDQRDIAMVSLLEQADQ